jgi:hypothetical protein
VLKDAAAQVNELQLALRTRDLDMLHVQEQLRDSKRRVCARIPLQARYAGFAVTVDCGAFFRQEAALAVQLQKAAKNEEAEEKVKGLKEDVRQWKSKCVSQMDVQRICVVSYRIVSCRVVSCRVVSCRVVSCRVVSCRVVSCRVVS